MTNCVCGQQSILNTATGGLEIGGTTTLEGIPFRPDGGVTFGGESMIDVPQHVSYGYKHIFHLQESSSPYDNDGTGQNATATIPPTRTQNGLYGGYFQKLNGLEFIDIDSDSIDHSKPWTFSAWVAIDTFYQQRYLFTFGQNKIWWNVLNQFQFSTIFSGDEFTTWATSSTMVETDCWHHVVIVYKPNESISVYVDGVLEKTKEIEGTLPTANNASMGRDRTIVGRRAECKLQEVRLRYGVSSDARIMYEYLNGCGRGHVTSGSWEQP